ncbi:MAG: HPr kinase/phosphatase C-terminal domain-containing protein [Alphaproteobacteria bacterium]|nr:HPr kinase/phosphatase C-terminal domain-containing protein [Alphaproteobacteria bacterium]
MNCHGTSLVINKQGILLRGKCGSGKSDLALRLIHQGATLIADDQTEVIAKDKTLIATFPKPLSGKLEVRGIGILDVPFVKEHPLHILIDLVNWQNIERLPEKKQNNLKGLLALFMNWIPLNCPL